MNDSKNTINLTTKEKDNIKNELEDYIDNFDKMNPKLSSETQIAVREAANSGDKDLFDLACIVAYTAIENHYRRRAFSYKQYSNTEISDLMDELFIVISEKIIDYDGIHSLFTFFDPYINRAFMIARERGLGVQLTKYYQDMGVLISRAYSDLSAKDYDNPSITDISDYIKIYYGRNVSEKTILSWREQRQPISSLDSLSSPIVINDRTDDHPEKALENNEDLKEFYDSFEKLTIKHKELIRCEIEFDEANNRTPTVRELTKLFNEKTGDKFTETEVKSLRRAAHKEFKNHFLLIKNEDTDDNVVEEYEGLESFTQKFNYIYLDQDDEEDIKNAIESDIEYIFGEEPLEEVDNGLDDSIDTDINLDDF